MRSDRMKPRSGDWAVAIYFIQEAAITSLSSGSSGMAVEAAYPDWVMVVAILMITAGVLPIILVFLLRRFQCLKLDVSIHQGAIRRIDTTVSTKEMMGDVDIIHIKPSHDFSSILQDNVCKKEAEET
uniref:Uncharacterized protein n=1 Tax=Timema cristinae TaxID=61476 RepID=A0A7R9CCU6_TIMCR|nr:unnamed protein product [Timema cristinae]